MTNNTLVITILVLAVCQARKYQYFTRTSKDTVIATQGENVRLV